MRRPNLPALLLPGLLLSLKKVHWEETISVDYKQQAP